jgi:hypothetical protein
MILASTSALISVTTGSAVSTISIQASWVDLNGSTITPGDLNTQMATATTTTVIASPAASTQRRVKFLSIYNSSASSCKITVNHNDGTTLIPVFEITLQSGYTIQYNNEGNGFVVYDASGNIQQAVTTTGRFLKRTYILSGTTSFTTQAATTQIIARMIAAGGQGGGGAATTGECGSGGGSGSYAEWNVAVSGNTAYTCAVGAGGSTGGTGAAGQTGGNTTLTIGGTTVTCNGGTGGAVGTSISVPVLGGAGGAISTNGSLNAKGKSGDPSVCTGTAADNAAGAGADSPLGSGGGALLNAGSTGNTGGGYGAGGGGGGANAGASAGGAGAPGLIAVDEYS